MTARGVLELVQHLIHDGPDAFLLIDDSVQDKRYSQLIDLVKCQYSDPVQGSVRGIGIVNLVHSSSQPIDYRIYVPEADSKTKNDHFREMQRRSVADNLIQAKTVLFDL